jgi:glycosyltransferase involved in cell wall biosynthesis
MIKKSRKSVGIVQSHPTQFDGPLFRFLEQQPDIDLTVYFYHHQDGDRPYDKEIQRNSEWDHDVVSGYNKVYAERGLWGKLKFVRRILGGGGQITIVSGYGSPVVLLIALIGRLLRLPVGLRSDNILQEFKTRSIKGRIKKIFLPVLFRIYTTGHPVGTLAEAYLINFGFKRSQLFRFPYAVDNEYLKKLCDSHRKNQESLRDQIGIRKKSLVVLGIMKFSEHEDPMTLLKGYQLVAEKVDDIHMVLVGDGPLRREMEDFIRGNGLKNITLPGYRPYSELPRYYAISDVFIHTARRGSWEVSVQESLACGVPVIVADTVGSACDLIIGKNTGLVFKSGDPRALADAMLTMLQDYDLRRGCQSAAQGVVQNWSYQTTLTQLRATLKRTE